MGNENSKNKEPKQNGKIPEKHENGSVNGVSANITSKGLEIDCNGETVVKTNGGPLSLSHGIESTEPDCAVVESVAQKAEAPVISETPEAPEKPEIIEPPATVETPEPPAAPATPEPTVKKEEAKKKKVRGFGSMFKKKAEAPAEPAESSPEKEISHDDPTDVSLPASEPQPESGSIGDEAATTIVTERREDLDNLHQRAEISTQTDNDISTQTSGDDNTAMNTQSPVEEVVVETAATEDERQLNESVVVAEEVVEETAGEEPRGDQIVIEEVVIMGNDVYENIVFRAERVEVTDNCEITHIKSDIPEEESMNKTEPEISAEPDKSITGSQIVTEENNAEETVEVSFSLPKVVADCVEAVFAADSDSSDFAGVNTSQPRVDEVITEDNIEGAGEVSADAVVIKAAEPECNAVTPEAREANGLPPLDEKPATAMVEAIMEVIREEPNPTSANQVKELSVPGATEILGKEKSAHEEVTTDDAAEVKGVSERQTPSTELITNEEPHEVKPECIPEVVATDETAQVGEDLILHLGPEPSPAIVKDETDALRAAAIDVLSQVFSAVSPQDPAMDNYVPPEEEVIVATCFVPLTGEQEARLTFSEEPSETTAEELNREALEALSNEFDAVPGSVEGDPAVLESSDDVLSVTGESEPPVSVQEGIAASDELMAECAEAGFEMVGDEIIMEDITTECNAVTVEEAPRIVENCQDSGIATSDRPVAECVEADLESVAEEIITGEVPTEFNHVTPDKEAPESTEGEKTENESQNETILSTDVTDLLAKLQSACASIVVDSACSLGGFEMSSTGYTITVSVHVAPNKEE